MVILKIKQAVTIFKPHMAKPTAFLSIDDKELKTAPPSKNQNYYQHCVHKLKR